MKSYSAPAIALLAGGCASLTGGQHSDISDTGPMMETPDAWAVTLPDPAPESDWIDQFGSAQMKALVAEALSANFSLQASQASADADRALLDAARGRRLPSLDAEASAGYTTYGQALGLNDSESYGLGLSARWEPDLWGRVSRRISIAYNDLAASEADLAGLRLSIAAQTAKAWISLSNARAQLLLAEDELEVRARSSRLTERRFAAGISTSLDVRLARSTQASARASIANAQLSVANAARALETLLGRYPRAEIEAPDTLPMLAPMVDISSPVDLLARRPDIAAAEARLASAGLRADLARLAMRPTLTLSASAGADGLDNNTIEHILDVDYLAGRVLANLSAPLFNGGALKAEAEAARANARAAIANYGQTVLSAWQEVENVRHADISLAMQEDALTDALVEAEAAEILAERQYQQGLITIFDLITAQSRRISAQRQLLAARADRAANRINYHLALGGGDLSNFLSDRMSQP